MRPFLAFAALALATSAAAQNAIDVTTFIKATFAGGTLLQDPDVPVSFQLTPGWVLRNGSRWGNHETTLSFGETQSGAEVALYYQYPLQAPYPKNVEAALVGGMNAKVRQRQKEGFPDYHVVPESVQTRQVGGQPALSFLGGFNQAGQPRVEYMVRVLGKNTKAHFFVIGIPATEDINAFCARFDQIALSLLIQ
jgi:hypothetical protein